MISNFLFFLLPGLLAADSGSYTLQTIAGDGLPDHIQALSANLGIISGVATDRAGNVYMSLLSYSVIVRMDISGMLTVVAGNGTRGFSGDNGPATAAQLDWPRGLAVDPAGNLYISDTNNSRIRRVVNGIITTFAGSADNSPGGGDNGPATGAGLFVPYGISFDSSGSLYIAESGHNRIRKVSSGIITTIAGTGSAGVSSGDGGPAILAQLYNPVSVAVDAAGTIYVAESGSSRIRKISNGIISTFVGPGLFGLTGVFLDSTGNVYSVTPYQISKQGGCGSCVTLIAGKFLSPIFSGDGGLATDANLADATDATFDSAGNLYIVDAGADCLRKVTNGIIQTVAGHGLGDDGNPAIHAELPGPYGIATDLSGNIYMADPYGQRIRKFSNGVISTVAGNGIPGFSGDGGPATDAELYAPSAVAVDAAGSLYITDSANQRIRKVSNGVITTVAGNGDAGYNRDNIAATDARLCQPDGIAVDSAGSIYFNDGCNYRVRKVSNGVITTVAGNGTYGDSGDNGPATSAQLWNGSRPAVDSAGNLYLLALSRVRKVSNGIISTFAGTGTVGFSGDGGPASSAELQSAQGIAVDSLGNVYIGDGGRGSRIRKVVNGIISTIAGDDTLALYGGVGLPGGSALNLALDSKGNVYFSDTIQRILRVASCMIATDVSAAQFTKLGGTLVVNILGPSGCAWSVTGLPDWITVSGAASGIAPGTLTLVAAPNSGAPRSAAFSVSAPSVTFNQTDGGCTYSVDPSGQAFPPSSANGSKTVTTEVGCPWTVTGVPSWITVTSGGSGAGNGSVGYQVAANSGPARSAVLSIAGVGFEIEQQAASIPGLGLIGSMPHIAAEENWTTTFTFVNKISTAAQARFSLFGDPGSPLPLPLIFPQQQSAGAAPLFGASIDRTLAGNGSLIVATGGSQTPPVQVGSAQLSANGAVDGFAIFHLIPGAQEAVVPMETRDASSYLLAFDNTGGVVLAVAAANVSTQPANIAVILRDDSGAQIGSGNLALAGSGHTSFVLPVQYPIAANKRGTIEFDTPPGGRISVLGIRTTPLGGTTTLTTIPALAAVGTSGGSIAHLASGNGWQTTFVLVNTGVSPAQTKLNFFADQTGAPLTLPISFPQMSGSVSMFSSLNETLPPGATLLVQSTGALTDPLLTGSAQLTTNGNVSGFVIFRYTPNGQEAVVPLESRTANAYIVAFDNTGGAATGIAVNSVSPQPVNIPVVVRDDTGAQIAIDTLALPANGHLAFTLASDKYPATANIRGTIEFDTPAGGTIGALGIRIPLAHTFTTLPALIR